MVEFRTLYYGPMDRNYHEKISEVKEEVKLESPIIPISQLGETVPESDPQGRNILQTTQAAIHGGAGTVQLVMTTPHTSAIGGRAKSYGKEVRAAIRESAMAAGVNIAGVELPTSLNNMSGFDHQSNNFSDEAQRKGLDEVKDAIKFVADVGRGGGVDIVSWEFVRQINEAPWSKEDKNFKNPGEQEVGFVVDKRNGRVQGFRRTEKVYLPVDPDKNFAPVDPNPDTGEVQVKALNWEQFQKYTDYINKKEGRKEGEKYTPEEYFIRARYEAQMKQLEGYKLREESNAETCRENITALKNRIAQGSSPNVSEDEKKIDNLERQRDQHIRSAQGQAQEVENYRQQMENVTSVQKYGLNRSTTAYAEAGIFAMRETEVGIKSGRVDKDKPIHVGPEIGWPEYYGSHPTEFVNLVKGSRARMIELLTKPTIKDPSTEEPKKNPFFDPSINQEKAKELANNHIKGLFDTSHMGMWLAYFEPKPGESEEKRIGRFKDWYLDQVKKIADEGVIGGVQLVDSASAAHGHLPPGEGIFPVIDAAKILRNKGYKGFMVSEGHEEEKFERGRIRTKMWQHAGANIGSGYFGGYTSQQPIWRGREHGYFGKTYSPLFMFGSYAPSNEFKLWSEVPLE